EINSHRMLWSMAGNLAMVHRVFMGISFETDGLYFNPVVPAVYGGEKTLSNFTYRDANLNITVKGHGNKIKTVTINGEPAEKAFIPTSASGNYGIVIELANNTFPEQAINLVDNHFSLPTVQLSKAVEGIAWEVVEGAAAYRVYKNGVLVQTTTETLIPVSDEGYANYQVCAIDEQGYEGFSSEPFIFSKEEQIIEMETFAPKSPLPYTNYSGDGFVEVSLARHTSIDILVTVEKAGDYLLDFRYSNGSGRWNTDNKCAIRSLTVNDTYQGAVVFPQRGMDEWSDWGFSNSRKVRLNAGTNTVKVHFEDWNNNMNVDVNTAMLDYLRVIPVQ
ncbi:MAG: glycogen debranching protein, partial [Bacteroidota bacterium]